MKKLLMKGITLALILVLVLGILPAMAPKAEAAVGDVSADNGVVFFEDNFDSYTSAANFKAAYPGSTFHSSATFSLVNDNGDQKLKVTASRNVNNYIEISGLDLPIRNTGRYQLGLKVEIGLSNVTTTDSVHLQTNGNDNFKCSYVDSSGAVTNNATQTTSYTMKNLNNGTLATSANVSSGTNQVLTAYISAPNNYALRSFMFNFYLKGTSDVTVDFFRVSVVCGMGSKGWDSSTAAAMLGYDNAYIKLQGNMTISANKTMGTKTVIDLNGHTLTFAAGTGLSLGVNARIVDTSAEKTGKLVIDQGKLISTNIDHPTVPLWIDGTRDGSGKNGYVFVEKPAMTEDTHTEVVASPSGFTLQFRPAFGYLNEDNIREQYLSGIESGVELELSISWVDAFGNTPEAPIPFGANLGFDAMYANARTCGEVTVNNIHEFQEISIYVTLDFCGVRVDYAPIVFDNTYLTIHYAQDYDQGKLDGIGTNRWTWSIIDGRMCFNNTSGVVYANADANTATAGRVYVLDFDYWFTDTTDGAKDYFVLGRRQSSSEYYPIISAREYFVSEKDSGFDGSAKYCCYTTPLDGENISNGEKVNFRLAVDMGTGFYKLSINGEEVKSATNADLPAWLAGYDYIDFKEYKYMDIDPVDTAYQFDNFLVYSYSTVDAQQ